MDKRFPFFLVISILSVICLNTPIGSASDTACPFDDQESAMVCFAALLKIPAEHPTVSVEVRNTRVEEGLMIEDIAWTSLDGQEPMAYVIRPKKTEEPLPAIICLHGTGGSREAMAHEQFKRGEWTRPGNNRSHTRMLGWARELARRGYLALALTQRGLDIRTPNTNDQAKDQLVRGRTLMGAIVYEIRQAITHLHQRDDVNPEQIGITGMSFGGITTFYSWLVDDRIDAAAPLCGGVGSVDIFLKTGSVGYHGFYWWIPNMLVYGDQADFAAAMAPRPLMLWAPTKDVGMPKPAVDQFISVVKPAYEKAGKPGNFVVHQPEGEHSFTMETFEGMVVFFDDIFGR